MINTRADLDALTGTPAHATFISALRGTLTRQGDGRTYPTNYNAQLRAGDEGYLAPQFVDIPDDTVAARYGYTRAALLAL